MIFRLPVSGQLAALQEPSGHEEMLLLSSTSGGFAVRTDIVRRLVPPLSPGVDWDQLPVADVDAALLALRRRLLGERLVAEVRCSECGAPGDVAFTVSSYLQSRAPKPPRGVSRDEEGGYLLGQARLRLPTVAAYREAESLAASAKDLAERLEHHCFGDVSGTERRRVLWLLERLAPLLGGDIEGSCPECGARVRAWFEPGDFVLAELRQLSARLYEEIHLLASAYHWSEPAILDLPARRRTRYAELAVAGLRQAPVAPATA